MKFEIEGYESMTAEQKQEALEAFITGYDPEKNGYVSKSTFDKASSQTADFKRQVRDAQEAIKGKDDYSKQLEGRIEELEKNNKINATKAQYLALGYSEELASSSAKALVENDSETLFKNQKAFNESLQKNLRAQSRSGMTQPPAGDGSKGTDYSKLIADAQASGNISLVAYYTRLQQTNADNNT